jgi:hypothetical protein
MREEGGGAMLYKFGRFLQVVGMLLLPIGIAGNVADPNNVTLGTSLMISGTGMVVFFLGYQIQQMGRPK